MADTARPRGAARACGAPAFDGRASVFKQTRVDALALSHRRVVRAAAAAASSRRGSGGGEAGPRSPLLLAAPDGRAGAGCPAPPRRRRGQGDRLGKTEVTVGEAFTRRAEGHRARPGRRSRSRARPATEQFELRTPVRPAAAAAPAPSPAPHRYEAAVFASARRRSRRSPCATGCPTARRARPSSEPVALRVVSLLPKDEERAEARRHPRPGEVGIGRAFWVALGARARAGGRRLVVWLVRRRRTAEAPRAVRRPGAARRRRGPPRPRRLAGRRASCRAASTGRSTSSSP